MSMLFSGLTLGTAVTARRTRLAAAQSRYILPFTSAADD
jgi:hypothetical protein